MGYLMKKTLLIIALITSVTLAHSETQPEEPLDTDGNGYLNISTLAHLRWLSEVDSTSSNFELENDIDASETRVWNFGDHDKKPTTPDSAMGWRPIGGKNKQSTFNSIRGNGNTIIGLYINRPMENHVGFLGRVSSTDIESIRFREINVFGGWHVGGLAGQIIISKTTDVAIEGNITGNDIVGGIAGEIENGLDITNCSFRGEISGRSDVGGIAGYFWNIINMSRCNVEANITGQMYVGGLVGTFGGGGSEISLCYSNGEIVGDEYVGGITGRSYNGSITSCYSRANLIGKNIVGGIVGESSDGWGIEYCYYAGAIDHEGKVGGIVAQADEVNSANYWDIELSGVTSSASGSPLTTLEMKTEQNYKRWDFETLWVINPEINDGYPFLRDIKKIIDTDGDGYLEINNLADLRTLSENPSYWSDNIELTSDINARNSRFYRGHRPIGNSITNFTGNFNGNGFLISDLTIYGYSDNVGLFGIVRNGFIENLHLRAINFSAGTYVGGIAGNIDASIIRNCSSEGRIISNGGCVGGLIGKSNSVVEECYSEVYIEKNKDATGGLIGCTDPKSITQNCFTKSSVSASRDVGGLIGFSRGKIVNTYSISTLREPNGSNHFGGLIGRIFNNNGKSSNVVENSYWDSEAIQWSVSDGGTPRTTAQMKTRSNYEDWDFDIIWAIDPNLNDGYPYLRGLSPVFSVQEDYATEEKEILIYPNPATNKISLNTPTHTITQVSVYSLTGSLLLSQGYSQDIDVSTLNAGRYIVAAETTNGKIITGKFEKR
ncbi:MAG: hypothetical protein Kapaf2KO_06480 [Candidatus Kapaibacteriales bacterium]